jgi:predicted acyl esterase
MIEERDIIVAMRDGTRLAVDVYRPDAPGKYPVLYASALHNKDLQGPDIADVLPPQPATHLSGSGRSRRAIRGVLSQAATSM